MTIEVLMGFAVVLALLAAIVAFVLYSRLVINRIADRGLRTARDIVRELNDGR